MTHRRAATPARLVFAGVPWSAVSALVVPTLSARQAPLGPAGSPPNSRWTPVKSIDFSSKHDVLIKNEDGTLTPMDVPYYRTELIAPGTWQILSDGDFAYLVEGDNEALAIDSLESLHVDDPLSSSTALAATSPRRQVQC